LTRNEHATASLQVFPQFETPCTRAVEFAGSKDAIVSLQTFLRFETVCNPAEELSVGTAESEAFLSAKRHITEWYKGLVTGAGVMLSDVNSYSMLIEWRGARPELPGVLLYGHYDVVPVGNNTTASWTHPPFGGELHDGCVLHRYSFAACILYMRPVHLYMGRSSHAGTYHAGGTPVTGRGAHVAETVGCNRTASSTPPPSGSGLRVEYTSLHNASVSCLAVNCNELAWHGSAWLVVWGQGALDT
jgi:hypothetical protein